MTLVLPTLPWSKRTVERCGVLQQRWQGGSRYAPVGYNSIHPPAPHARSTYFETDPANNLVYEAHQYFDRDHSGSYQQSYDDSDAHPDIGVERLRPFAEWLEEHNVRGFLGEFGSRPTIRAGSRSWTTSSPP